MEQAKLVGVGFMGKPDRVSRLLDRMMEFTNRSYDLSESGCDHQASLFDTRSVKGFYLGFTPKGLCLSLIGRGIEPGSEKNYRITYVMKHRKNSLQ